MGEQLGLPNVPDAVVAPKPKRSPLHGMYAAGRLKTGQLNKLEQLYLDTFIKPMAEVGAILWWKFEGLKLRLADNTTYSPDFAVMTKDGTLEMHEVKGFWKDDAKVKVKVAAEAFPFVFVVVTKNSKKNGGGWNREEV